MNAGLDAEAVRETADAAMPALHVAHIISGLGQGGAEAVLARLLTAPGQRHRHTVISMTDAGVHGPRLRAAGIVVETLDIRGAVCAPVGLLRLWRLLRRLRPDVVQTWMYDADFLGGLVARLAGIRAVAWGIRNSGAALHQASRKARVLAWCSARVSRLVPRAILACAHEAARRHQAWGYDAGRMTVIANGYDLARWQPDADARARLRKQAGIAEDAFLVGCVARWNPLKDHGNLLRALALLKADGRAGLRCVLIGHGMVPENTALRDLLQHNGLRDDVLLLGPRDDVPDWMNALDLHVLPSLAEGFPNVLAEAMSCGTPCVTTDVGDAARIAGREGWVVPARDPAALAGAIAEVRAMRGTEALALRCRAGRARIAAEFGLRTMVDAYDAVWRCIAAPEDPGRRHHRDDGPGPSRGAAARADTPAVLLFVVNNPAFFLSHRLAVAQGAQAQGYAVHVATPEAPDAARLAALGFTHHALPMSRSGKNPWQELRTLLALYRLFRRLAPDLVHAVTIKPVLYGGIAARLAGVHGFVAAVSGLGFVFLRDGLAGRVIRGIALLLYRLALGHPNSRVIFQNASDRDVLRRGGAVREAQVVMIRGSGVDLSAYRPRPEPDGAPVVAMAARLLADKGVREFVQAARLTRAGGSALRWVLAGSPDPGNPASIPREELDAWRGEGVVELAGEQSDIAAFYGAAHMVALPSYREGLPKGLIEAAACGRAVITTDVPGCRDAITPDETGLLVPVRDARALADAALRLALDAALRQRLGAEGRTLAESAFDVRLVVRQHLAVYAALRA